MRTVRSYILRGGRMTQAQSSALERLAPRWCVGPAEGLLDLPALFPGLGRFVLEIGFGMGETTAELAERDPAAGFLGIEVHPPGIGRLLWEIERRGLSNIRIINSDAVDVLERRLAPASFDGIHVFFPDPWPKKRHHKRRLIQPEVCLLLARVLKPDGYLRIVTDWRPYAEHILAVAARNPELHAANPAAAGLPGRTPTAFERKGLKAGRAIEDLIFIKKNA
jgi:tRNA (guanine-N7-)-methyltransferase